MSQRFLIILIMVFKIEQGFCQPVAYCEGFAGADFTLLSSKETKKYIENYADFHASYRDSHTKAYYLNSKTILFLDSFFEVNQTYKGLNVHFITHNTQVNAEQRKVDQTFLYFTPVKKTGHARGSDHGALLSFYNSLTNNRFFNKDSISKGLICPGFCDDSVVVWSKDNLPYSPLQTLPGSANNKDKVMFSNKTLARASRDRYKSGQGREFNDEQTTSIYFKRSTFSRLKKFLSYSTNLNTFPLIGIYFGSYDSLVDVNETYQQNKRQTVLGFAPLTKVGVKFEPDLCSYINFIKLHYPLDLNLTEENGRKRYRMIDNHGELCPRNCPPTGD